MKSEYSKHTSDSSNYHIMDNLNILKTENTETQNNSQKVIEEKKKKKKWHSPKRNGKTLHV